MRGSLSVMHSSSEPAAHANSGEQLRAEEGELDRGFGCGKWGRRMHRGGLFIGSEEVGTGRSRVLNVASNGGLILEKLMHSFAVLIP